MKNQSYDHMQGILQDASQHPAVSLPDPMGGQFDGSQLPTPPGMSDTEQTGA